ncbi:MAG: hypothetical protein COV46_00550 [Deltaproteobacteria bacterium CG11_big_fil_rev_8_21_14_0_20_49_13]|nr:MAG: hypothetical protein COV46_00550 [Deltaproteobacteria bacterium CG11_big_fil_rev_8_21_14_0_20_49_13]
MSNINIQGLEAEIPENWQVQGMLTLTLPSPDKNVRPNIILTKELLPRPMELTEYFGRIRESIEKRGIKDLKISDEKDLVISGVRGKMMICSWDVSAMAAMLGKEKGGAALENIKPGQQVKQIQVTLLKEQLAINMTASFPSDKFDIYYRPFQQFLKTLKIS